MYTKGLFEHKKHFWHIFFIDPNFEKIAHVADLAPTDVIDNDSKRRRELLVACIQAHLMLKDYLISIVQW